MFRHGLALSYSHFFGGDMPHISWGMTRFVILVGPVAIKIARFRIMWIPKRFLHFVKSREVGTKIAYQARNPRLAFNNIFAGLIANRNEYLLWQKSHRHFLVPTLYSLLGGVINIQRRGERVSAEELIAAHPFRELLAGMPSPIAYDMTKAVNFGKHEGRICLVDYGGETTGELFTK